MKKLILFLLLSSTALAQDLYKRSGEAITFTVDLSKTADSVTAVSIYRRTTVDGTAIKLTSIQTIGMKECKFVYTMPPGTTTEYRFTAYPTQKGKPFRSGSNEIIVGRAP